jgi:HTH-type transcriptional regulator, sugar sensing transcriptional regulator
MDLEILEKIGFTKGEKKIYLALLELGETTTGNIIKKSGISGSKTYDILDKLMQKGLVSFIIKEQTKYFNAAPLNKIIAYIEEKEKELKENKQKIREIIPELELRRQFREVVPSATIYMGLEGTKTVFNNIIEKLKAGEEYLVFTSSPENLKIEKLQLFFRNLHLKRVEKRIHSKMIAPLNSKKEIKKIIKGLPFVEAKFSKSKISLDTVIFGNYVLISVFKEEPINFEIHSKDVAENFRNLFFEFWKGSIK